MDWTIRPNVGIGLVDLGMTLVSVRQALGKPDRSFRKIPFALMDSDAYAQGLVQVHYNDSGVCEAVEVFAPERAILENRVLTEISFREAKAYCETFDSSLVADADGLTSHRLGIGVYAPDKESNAPIQSVLVFEKSYYDPDKLAELDRRMRAHLGLPPRSLRKTK